MTGWNLRDDVTVLEEKTKWVQLKYKYTWKKQPFCKCPHAIVLISNLLIWFIECQRGEIYWLLVFSDQQQQKREFTRLQEVENKIMLEVFSN